MTRHALTDRFFAALGAVQLLGVLAIGMPGLLPVFASALAALLATALLDRVALGRSPVPALSAELAWDGATEPVLGSPVALKVTAEGAPRAGLRLRPPRFRTLRLDDDYASPEAPSGAWRFEGSAFRLGFETLDAVEARSVSRLGFWLRSGPVAIPALSFRVLPPQKEISHPALRQLASQQSLFLQGNRRLTRGLASEQFHSVRKFQAADPLRDLDHKKSAKYGTWMTRTYESRLNQHLVIALDLGRSLTGRIGSSGKIDYYLSACLALARDAIRNADHVSFVALSREVRHSVVRARSLGEFRALHEGRAGLAPSDAETDWELLPRFLQGLSSQKNLVLVLTDASRPSVQTSLLRVMPALCRRNLVAVLSLDDSEFALEPRLAREDSAGGDDYAALLYGYWLREKEQLFRRELARYGAGALSVSERDWLGAARKTYEIVRLSSYT